MRLLKLNKNGSALVIALFFAFCMLILLGALVFKVTLDSTQNIKYLFYVGFVCLQLTSINVLLAVFNLIPIPPLDGSRLVHYLLPAPYKAKYYLYAKQYALLIMILVFMYAGPMIRPVVENILYYLGFAKFGQIEFLYHNEEIFRTF